jgi:hypothetical protein
LGPVGALSNYAITYNTALFTINAKTASVTPAAAGKIYGASDPTLTGTLSGFLAADGVTEGYSRTAGETVAGGPYTISAVLSPSGVLGNYTITYNTAAFTITRKSASVTPNAGSKTLGAADPTLSGSLSGFLTSDNVTALYHRTAGETVAGNPYTISATLSPADVLGNYTVTYGTAPFTIGYAVCVLYDQTKSVQKNATIPVKIFLCNANGGDVSSSAITVTATGMVVVSGSASPVIEDSGNANPENNFRFDPTLGPSGGYIFNLSTKPLGTGTFSLQFTATGDAVPHSVMFGVR